MRYRGIVLVVAAVALVGASLSGCSNAASSSGDPVLTAGGEAVVQQYLQASSEPKQGSCWTLSFAQLTAVPAYPAGNPVACAGSHQAYTIAVVNINGGASTPAPGTTTSTLGQEADIACSQSYRSLLPGVGDGRNSRVALGYFVEPQTLWGTGPIWARCDIVESAIGSSLQQQTLANLPTNFSSFVSAVKAKPSDYFICISNPGTNGTTGPNLNTATLAPCATANWTLEPSPRFSDPAGEAYPGYTALEKYMHPHCGVLYDSATKRGWVFYPSASQWAAGDRSWACWVGPR